MGMTRVDHPELDTVEIYGKTYVSYECYDRQKQYAELYKGQNDGILEAIKSFEWRTCKCPLCVAINEIALRLTSSIVRMTGIPTNEE